MRHGSGVGGVAASFFGRAKRKTREMASMNSIFVIKSSSHGKRGGAAGEGESRAGKWR